MLDYFLKALPFIVLAYFSFDLYSEYEDHLSSLAQKKSQIAPLDGKINRITKEIKEIDQVRQNIEEYRAKIDQYNEEIDMIKEKVPSLDDRTKILDELKNIADSINIRQTVFRPKYVQNNEEGVYFTNGIEFEASGTYLQFLMLFEKLAGSSRLLNVAQVKLRNLAARGGRGRTSSKASSKHNLISISAIIESFHLSDLKKVKKGGK